MLKCIYEQAVTHFGYIISVFNKGLKL